MQGSHILRWTVVGALVAACLIFLVAEKETTSKLDSEKAFYDNALLLIQLPVRYYHTKKLNSSFPELVNYKDTFKQLECGLQVKFLP
ncbi:MAG: hypothetical protein NZ522_04100, partial [Chitinophagales bacterium]|nr:hypothetical protein [Chitinophagales bacterium]